MAQGVQLGAQHRKLCTRCLPHLFILKNGYSKKTCDGNLQTSNQGLDARLGPASGQAYLVICHARHGLHVLLLINLAQSLRRQKCAPASISSDALRPVFELCTQVTIHIAAQELSCSWDCQNITSRAPAAAYCRLALVWCAWSLAAVQQCAPHRQTCRAWKA